MYNAFKLLLATFFSSAPSSSQVQLEVCFRGDRRPISADVFPREASDALHSLAKRREDLTPAQFYEHWEKVHAPLTAPWLVKHKVLAYSQVAESEPSPSSSSNLT